MQSTTRYTGSPCTDSSAQMSVAVSTRTCGDRTPREGRGRMAARARGVDANACRARRAERRRRERAHQAEDALVRDLPAPAAAAAAAARRRSAAAAALHARGTLVADGGVVGAAHRLAALEG